MRKSRASRTRILMPLYYYHPYVSGVSVYAKTVAEGLVSEGYEVTVLTSQYDKTLPRQETINGVRVVRRPVLFRLNKGVIMPLYWLDIVRFARHNDYVNTHLPMAEAGLAALGIPKRKLVTTYHCDLFLGNKLFDKIITAVSFALMRLQLSRSRVVVPSTKDYLEHSKMRKFISKATPIYPPISPEETYFTEPGSLFKKLKVSDKEIKIGFVGRIVYEKGIKYLLEAIPYLQKQLPAFKIVIVGDYEKVAGGSVKDELDEYMDMYPNTILFTGYLSEEDKNRFYSGIDVLVLPSIDPLEAFGMVQVEAMLCGAPVVASNLPGVREVVRKSGYGKISNIKDPKDIAENIIEVVKHRKKYTPDRNKIIQEFSKSNSIESYANLMPKVTRQGGSE